MLYPRADSRLRESCCATAAHDDDHLSLGRRLEARDELGERPALERLEPLRELPSHRRRTLTEDLQEGREGRLKPAG